MISNRLRLFILVDYLFISIYSMAQSLSENVEFESQLESLIFTHSQEDKEIDNSVEDLVDNLISKVDLNRASAEVLTELLILTPAQIKAIIDYRNRVGTFKSVYELQFIYALDRETLHKLQPFVYVEELSTKLVNKSGYHKFYLRHELSSRLGIPFYKRLGDQTKFLGPPVYNNIRYRGQLNKNIEFGLVGEKDAGEPLFALNNRCGYDYYSYYLLLKNIYKFNVLCLGLFRVNFGLGLTVGTSSFGGKWSALQTLFKSESSIQKHASVSEFNYFRGIASIYTIKDFELSTFFSSTRADGTLKDQKISSVHKTGVHRTTKELESKNRVKQLVIGQRISYSNNHLKFGVNGVFYRFNYPLAGSNLSYKKYDIQGNQFYNVSADYTFYLHDFILKGELAKGKKGEALLHKLYYAPHPCWDFLLIHRFYSYDYWGYLASTFGNQVAVKNENGWYLNIQSSVFTQLKINLYADFCAYPWYRYRVSKSSKSIDLGLALDYAIYNNQQLRLKVNYRATIRDIVGDKTKTQAPIKSYKIHSEYSRSIIQHVLSSKTMIDYIGVKAKQYESGHAFTQRFSYSSDFISCALQYSYFHTPSFDTRIYIYENNLLYSPSISSFNGYGQRCSCLLNCKLCQGITLSLKYGMTYYWDRNSIGSGVDKIASRQKSDLSLMGRFKF